MRSVIRKVGQIVTCIILSHPDYRSVEKEAQHTVLYQETGTIIAGPVLSPLSSIVFTLTSFHGLDFFPGGIGLDDPLTVFAASEAFMGLLIEVSFIATVTQRLFEK